MVKIADPVSRLGTRDRKIAEKLAKAGRLIISTSGTAEPAEGAEYILVDDGKSQPRLIRKPKSFRRPS